MITSLNNEKVKQLTKLNQSKYRKELGLFLVEGEHLVSEAKALGLLIEAYTISNALEGTLINEAVMRKICKTNTVVRQIGVCRLIDKNEIKEKVLILDKIQDPGNLGVLMRSAVAFGFETIFLANGCVDIFNDKTIRSSQGAIFKLNIISGEIIPFINELKKTHLIYGTSVIDGKDIKNIDTNGNVAVILGNEASGISEEVKNLNLENIILKMINTESLNVGVAGSIIMYEFSK